MDGRQAGWTVVACAVLGTALQANDPPPPARTRTATASLEVISIGVVDERGAAPSTSEARLFESRTRRPVLTPGRRQVTLAQFIAASGELSAECVRDGTAVRIRLRGLVPDGSYSLWSFVFAPPGRTTSLEHATGAGVLGAPGARAHAFTADPRGEAYVALTVPPGPMSSFGSLRGCVLDEFQWMIVGTYNLDGRPPRREAVLDGSVVEQFGFNLRR